jgi:hypothetical protein
MKKYEIKKTPITGNIAVENKIDNISIEFEIKIFFFFSMRLKTPNLQFPKNIII